MSGPQGDLTADRIALVLADGGGRTLERIEGYGAVEARIEAREAKGARLTHLATTAAMCSPARRCSSPKTAA